MEPHIEEEQKFYINDTSYNRILQDVRKINSISDYGLTGFSSETINFRYFDTFDGVLTEKHIFNYFRQVDSFVDPPAKVHEYGYVYTVEFPEGKMKPEDIQKLFIPKGVDFYRLSPYDFKYWGPMNRIKQVGRNDYLQEQLRLDIDYNRFVLRKKEEEKLSELLFRDRLSKKSEEKSESSVLVSLDKVLVTGNFNRSDTFYQISFKTSNDNDKSVQTIYDFFMQKDHLYFYLAPEPIWIKARNLILGEKINKTPAKPSVT